MRDTVWSIVLTQAPIAVACFWVAWEIRCIGSALRDIGASLRALLTRLDDKATKK